MPSIFTTLGFIGGVLLAIVALAQLLDISLSRRRAGGGVARSELQFLLLLLMLGVLVAINEAIRLLDMSVPEAFKAAISITMFAIAIAMVYLRYTRRAYRKSIIAH